MLPETLNTLVFTFAMESFRDMADGDYVAARMTYRANLLPQALWASEQAIEKYLKTILLLRRIRWQKSTHSVLGPLEELESRSRRLGLSEDARCFARHIDRYGQDRYLTYPYAVEGPEIARLDRTVWELRRYCSRYFNEEERKYIEGVPTGPPHAFRPSIPGLLEQIIENPNHPAHSDLLWRNAYFGGTATIEDDDAADDLGFQGVNSFLSRYTEAHYLELYIELRTLIKLPKDAGDQVLPEKYRG